MKDKFKLLESLFDNSQYFIRIKDEKCRFAALNDKFVKYLKKTREKYYHSPSMRHKYTLSRIKKF